MKMNTKHPWRRMARCGTYRWTPLFTITTTTTPQRARVRPRTTRTLSFRRRRKARCERGEKQKSFKHVHLVSSDILTRSYLSILTLYSLLSILWKDIRSEKMYSVSFSFFLLAYTYLELYYIHFKMFLFDQDVINETDRSSLRVLLTFVFVHTRDEWPARQGCPDNDSSALIEKTRITNECVRCCHIIQHGARRWLRYREVSCHGCDDE